MADPKPAVRRPSQATEHLDPDPSLLSPRGRSMLFIVPAWRREELSRICFAQHADCCQQLAESGLDAQVVVVADDGNLDAAAQAGLLTLDRPNLLGAKFNAGYQYAAENGFDYVCPLGSDSWIHPDRFAWLPASGSLLCTRNYVCIESTAERQGWFRIGYDAGTGSRVIPTEMLADCRYKPLEDARTGGCDLATLRKISRNGLPAFAYTNLHPFEVVGFSSSVQITPFYRLVSRFLVEWQTPFDGLADHYPQPLVDAARSFYGG